MRGGSASPANIGTPSDVVELEVVGVELTGLGVGLDVIDTVDRVDRFTKAWDVPAPGDVVAVMEDFQGSEAWDGRGGEQGSNVSLLAGERRAAELPLISHCTESREQVTYREASELIDRVGALSVAVVKKHVGH